MYANIVNEILGGISMYSFFSRATMMNRRRTIEKRTRNRRTMNQMRIQGIEGERFGGGGIRGRGGIGGEQELDDNESDEEESEEESEEENWRNRNWRSRRNQRREIVGGRGNRKGGILGGGEGLEEKLEEEEQWVRSGQDQPVQSSLIRSGMVQSSSVQFSWSGPGRGGV